MGLKNLKADYKPREIYCCACKEEGAQEGYAEGHEKGLEEGLSDG